MNMDVLKERLLPSTKDTKLNLSMVLTEEGSQDLSQKQIHFIALACAYATRSKLLVQGIKAEVISSLSEPELAAAQSVASLMAMTNVYYRFLHLVDDKSYASMPTRLRMNAMANHGINKHDFELASLAVSALNGCGMCIEAHTNELTKVGVTKLAIQSAVRIAAVMNAAAVSLDIADIT